MWFLDDWSTNIQQEQNRFTLKEFTKLTSFFGSKLPVEKEYPGHMLAVLGKYGSRTDCH